MDSKIEKQFAKFEADRNQLIQYLNSIDPNVLTQKPNPSTWSVVQVISHLIKVEEGTMRYIRKKLSFNPELKKAGILNAVRSFIINTSLAIPSKAKAPAALEETSNKVSYQEAISQWEACRGNMKTLFEELTETELGAAVYRNPLVGKISIYQQVSFLQKHYERHLKQINNIIQKVNAQTTEVG